jgi:hypothetical protein
MLANSCSDWLQTSIFQTLAAFTGNTNSDMLPIASWESASTVPQWILPSDLGWFMFPFVADFNLSNIGSLYWQKQQRNAPCHILKMSVNRVWTILVVAYLVIKSSR